MTETTVTQNAIDWHRVHQNIDLHLGIGKSILNFRGLVIKAQAAVNYNIWSSASGYYYSNNFSEITKFSTSQSNPYKKSSGLGAQCGLNIEKQIGEKTSIELKPFYGRYFRPITEENLSYQIKNSQIGLQIGISYRPTGSYKKH